MPSGIVRRWELNHDADSHASGQGLPSAEDTGSAAGDEKLATRLSELARLMQQEDPETILIQVVQAAVDLVPGTAAGSISVVTGRRQVHSEAASSDLPRRVDALQEETGEGPCLDAVFEQRTVRVPDMARETRWPHFSRRALAAGASGMLSFQLYVEGDNLGALNLFSAEAGAFDDESEHIGLLLAAHAAIAYAGAHKQEQLEDALSTRDLIGQAKGILIERHKLTGHQAFTLLIKVSQQSNRKLRDIADELVSSGELAGSAERSLDLIVPE